MKSTLDSKRRAVLPANFRPGDVVDLECVGSDTVVVRLLTPAPRPRLRLVRKRRSLVLEGGPQVTTEDVRRLLEDT
jgi:hypothetical protein